MSGKQPIARQSDNAALCLGTDRVVVLRARSQQPPFLVQIERLERATMEIVMASATDVTQYVFVPLHAELYAELVRRSGEADVSPFIEHSVESFLDRTEGDPGIWSAEYIEKLTEKEDGEYGNPKLGYQWNALFLPNGTKIRMTYKGKDSYAEIRHERLHWREETLSPSQFAARIADGTNRNAWRDLYIQFPGDGSWKLADSLRRQHTSKVMSLADF